MNQHTRNEINEFAGRIARHLQTIYKDQFGEEWVNRIISLSEEKLPPVKGWDEKDVMLITYGNSIWSAGERPLQTLKRFLDENLKEAISVVHILPFFPYTSDDGFAVSDFMAVNPDLGNWDDIREISDEYGLMSDLVINHVSSQHLWFKNFLGNIHPGRDFFIELDPETDYYGVIRPRSTPLFTAFKTPEGVRNVWTTFSADQIDLNFSNPEVLLEIIRILIYYIRQGAGFIRLDAIAYLWKRKNTPCLHLEETHEIIRLLRTIATYVCPGTIIVTETNVPNKENWSYFGSGDEAHMVYQFSLPPLLLHTLYSGNSRVLSSWALEIPDTYSDQTFLNYTASHDGIGVRPLEGLLDTSDMAHLIEGMIGFGGKISMKTNVDGTVSPYEINITYFDAMKGTLHGNDHFQEDRFLCSQTIMLALKGIPAVYIHSLLATPNDYIGIETSGRARSINRKQLSAIEVKKILDHESPQKRIFNEIRRRIKIRRQFYAFHPSAYQEVFQNDERLFSFLRYSKNTGEKMYCVSNITAHPVCLQPILKEHFVGEDVLSDERLDSRIEIALKPYQTRWIKIA